MVSIDMIFDYFTAYFKIKNILHLKIFIAH